jgi:C-terminal processing protease CtpA/Prc
MCYSATGWFLLEMKSLPYVKLIGDTTGGGSAQPIVRELPNGWIVRMSNSQRLSSEGKDDQYTGLYPDIPVWISQKNIQEGKDSILERAIIELRK